MLSRVAYSIYWMNRYIERVENIARFIDVNLHLILDQPESMREQWLPLVQITGESDWFFNHYKTASEKNVIQFLTFDRSYVNSIVSCLELARENARSIREIISSEMWEQINKLYLSIKTGPRSHQDIAEAHDYYAELKLGCHLFAGLMDATMSHGEAWHFGRMGRLIERADKTSRIVDVKYFILLPQTTDVGTPIDNIQWAALLKSASALEMYRKKFGRIHPHRAVEFLILDLEFPRSILYCLTKAEESLHEITNTPIGTFQTKAEQYLGRLRAELNFTSLDEIISYGMHEYLDSFQQKLNQVDDKIYETFFAMSLEPSGKT